MKISNELFSNSDSIIVVGLGPVGLAMTLESLKNAKGRKVIAITDRKDAYTRSQVLRLDEHSVAYLEKLLGEDTISDLLSKGKLEKSYIEKEKKNFYFVQVKTLEKVLFAALDKYNKGQLEIIYTTVESTNKITNINTTDHLLKINNFTESLPFKYLIAADGGKHSTATLLNIELKKRNEPIVRGFFTSYENTQRPQTHLYHAAAIFKIPEGETSKTYSSQVGKKDENNVSIEELRQQGWELNKKPDATTVLLVKDKLYIGAEIPKAFTQIKDLVVKKQKINDWLKLILKYYLSEEQIEKLTPEQYKENKKGLMKNMMQATAFEVILEEANRSLTPLPPKNYKNLDEKNLHDQTAYFFVVGDALRKTHYQTATGVNTGLLESEAFGKFLEGDESVESLQEYHASVAAARTESRREVDEYLEDQAQPHQKSKP